MKHVNRIVLVCLLLASAAWAQSGSVVSPLHVQVSAGYFYQGANQLPSDTWFSSNGGRADISVGDWHHLGLAAEIAGSRAVGLNSVKPAIITYMAGPRLSLALGKSEERKPSLFGQFLLGGVHASDGLYPAGNMLQSTANGLALSAGGGLEVPLHRCISLRLIQADYLYTHLPNGSSNYQGGFRLGAGITFRRH